ncbi:MAG: hypothetical protein K9N40_09105 [Candidatus Cloacimonetes bacterium]|nr:hypothetical protein [Candidatus Cloacimonadota bacterium]
MKYLKCLVLLAVLLISAFTAADESEDSDMISFAELPQPVQRSFEDLAEIDMILEIEMEEESESISCYEISIEEGDLEISYIFTQDGTLVEIKKEIELDAIPEISQKILKEKYPGLQVVEVEEIREIFYEIEGTMDGKNVVIEISNEGEIELESEDDQTNEEKDD